ncbi:hypothetical protein D9M69_480160 [compost metagenome]
MPAMTMKNSTVRITPGMIPAMSMSPTATCASTLYTTNITEGGMIGPSMPPYTVMPAAKVLS